MLQANVGLRPAQGMQPGVLKGGGGGGGGGSQCVKQRVLTRLWRFLHLNIAGCFA